MDVCVFSIGYIQISPDQWGAAVSLGFDVGVDIG
jgi:hypothetical protein